MKRLTIRTPKGAALKMNDTYKSEVEAKYDLMRRYRIAIDRLAAYEGTGLTPEEVAELKTPCDLCVYNPPSSRDGKACSMCPAMGKGGAE